MTVIIYILISVLLISLVSFTGLAYLSLDKKKLDRLLPIIISFAAGIFFGDIFAHLLPQAYASTPNTIHVAVGILSGVLIFFVLESTIRLFRCYSLGECEHKQMHGITHLAGDAVHNFLDGIIIASSYLVSIPLGLTTTFAIVLHELPKEAGDFAILLRLGFTRKRALFFNALTALGAISGALLVFFLQETVGNVQYWLLPITAGGFVYIAGSNLLPALQEETNIGKSLLQLFFLILGMGIMVWMKVLEG